MPMNWDNRLSRQRWRPPSLPTISPEDDALLLPSLTDNTEASHRQSSKAKVKHPSSTLGFIAKGVKAIIRSLGGGTSSPDEQEATVAEVLKEPEPSVHEEKKRAGPLTSPVNFGKSVLA